ncbi:MAG: sigma-70 family RNA polymerase sigma factor [Acidobacteria bacterium]|nr:sigma-70 family RNA polymerase sigma factor [Acidobacteriota bacterium]
MERRAAMIDRASEGQLIEGCRGGDRDAFRQLYELYHGRVWSIALHFTGDESLARDITQQVFLKLFTTIGQFREEARFATWLYRLVVNACLDEQRRRRRFISFAFFTPENERKDEARKEPPAIFENLTEDDCYMKLELETAVRAAVNELRPKLRIAILLKYFEGLSYQEMASALGCSPGTVASRLNRGHKELARKLAHLRGSLELSTVKGNVQKSR